MKNKNNSMDESKENETSNKPSKRIPLAERVGSENVALGLVFETPRKQKNDVPEKRGDFIENLEDEEILI